VSPVRYELVFISQEVTFFKSLDICDRHKTHSSSAYGKMHIYMYVNAGSGYIHDCPLNVKMKRENLSRDNMPPSACTATGQHTERTIEHVASKDKGLRSPRTSGVVDPAVGMGAATAVDTRSHSRLLGY
jgi:hypothetical protein